MQPTHIVALGEILIDYTPMPKSAQGMQVFEQNPGGAVANVLAAAAKLGSQTAFIGKVGNDMQGMFLKETLETAGIDTTGLVVDDNFFTTMAFVSLNDNGERSFAFARKPGADTQLTSAEVQLEIIENTRIFHCGSLSLTDNPAREATLFALRQAKKAGVIVSYDPNYRAMLWKSPAHAQTHMRSVLDYVDMIKISDEETELLTDEKTPEKAALALVQRGIPLVMVTLGAEGVLVANREGCTHVPGFKAEAVDTTGAGDAFLGGFLHALLQSGKTKPGEVTLKEAAEFATFANCVAALCVEKRGAIPAMPTMEQVKNRIQA